MKFIKKQINSSEEMKELGFEIAQKILYHLEKDGCSRVVELIGDVGAGKTTFTKGFAKSLGISENIQSPSFTISRSYSGKKFNLAHYDFYRLEDAGIMSVELSENILSSRTILVVEWAQTVSEILPKDRIIVKIKIQDENSRQVSISGVKI